MAGKGQPASNKGEKNTESIQGIDSVSSIVEKEWDRIVKNWERGLISDSSIDILSNYLEKKREEILKKRDNEDLFNDWIKASLYHHSQLDFISNRKKFNDDLREMWIEWLRDGKKHFSILSIESLRSMILITGAAILYSFITISGQISTPTADAVIVAKLTIFVSVLSLIMNAGGHALNSFAINNTNARIRSELIGYKRHRRMYALSRYMNKYYDPYAKWANVLIYGSMAVFGIGALISSIVMF